MVSESAGRNEDERMGGSERRKPRRPSRQPHGEGSRAGRNLTDAAGSSGGVFSDGTQTRTR